MTTKHTQDDLGNVKKDPETWVTGDEPMTGAQRSYLETLSEEAGESADESLTKAGASERIEELQKITGRGQPATRPAERSANERSTAARDTGTVRPQRD